MQTLRAARPRLSYANVMSTLAVVLAMGGVSWAAATLPKNSVSATQLKKNAVTAPKIKAGAVTTDKLAAKSVTAAKLATGAVNTIGLLDGGVQTTDLANGAVTAAKLAPGVGDVADGSITSAKVADGAVGTAEVADGAITSGKVADGSITANKLALGVLAVAGSSVGTAELADGAVTSSKLAAAAVTSGKVAAGAIGSSELADGTVTGTDLAAATVDTGNLAAGAVTTAKLAAGAVDTGALGAGSVTAAKLGLGAVDVNALGALSVTAAKLAAGAVTSGKIAAGAVGASEIADGTVGVADLTSGAAANGSLLGVSGGVPTWVTPSYESAGVRTVVVRHPGGTGSAANVAAGTALAAAIAALPAGPAEVVLEPGDYSVSAPLVLGANQFIRGAGSARGPIGSPLSRIINTSLGSTVLLTLGAGGGIENLRVQASGPGILVSTSSTGGSAGTVSDSMLVQQVTGSNSLSIAIDLGSSTGSLLLQGTSILIDGNNGSNNVVDGVRMFSSASVNVADTTIFAQGSGTSSIAAAIGDSSGAGVITMRNSELQSSESDATGIAYGIRNADIYANGSTIKAFSGGGATTHAAIALKTGGVASVLTSDLRGTLIGATGGAIQVANSIIDTPPSGAGVFACVNTSKHDFTSSASSTCT